MRFLTQHQIEDFSQKKPVTLTPLQVVIFDRLLLTAYQERLQSNPRCKGWLMTDLGQLVPYGDPPLSEEQWRAVPAAWARTHLRRLGFIPPIPRVLRALRDPRSGVRNRGYCSPIGDGNTSLA